MNHIPEVSTSLHQLERELRYEVSAAYFFSVNTALEILNLNAHRYGFMCKQRKNKLNIYIYILEEARTASEDWRLLWNWLDQKPGWCLESYWQKREPHLKKLGNNWFMQRLLTWPGIPLHPHSLIIWAPSTASSNFCSSLCQWKLFGVRHPLTGEQRA